MSFPSFSFLEKKKVLFLTHAGADIDSLASAAACFFSLKDNSKAKIGVPDHINVYAKHFAEQLKIPYFFNPESLSGFEVIVLLDFNNSGMLGSFEEQLSGFSGKLLLVDHHGKRGANLLKKAGCFWDESAVSTTELVFKWLNSSGYKLNKKAASCIAAGVLVDSAGFMVADSKTFRIMAEAMDKSGLNYLGLVSLVEKQPDIGEKIAKLKAARRCKIFKCDKYLIASTDVGAFEAVSASALVGLGADIAFAGDDKKNELLVSGRCHNTFVSETGFNLAQHVFAHLEKKFEGSSGGHAGAAAFNGKGNAQEALKECVSLAHKFIQKNLKKLVPLKEY
ncbi:MAG: DHH family phosphoesterase [Candidatus Diapherotrites archaeon]|uniref:DHH family phosphoesterase n=1 Tax=Candidatus Iainarchaeum sp. TaxID=3101447 RepID=A0A7J4IQX8_9ARCH|nr:MAG: phosphoesterase RecJ protein [archaeon GW2011_AR10]MBS3059284.1 DHH family phosphoesterase [Candidatus Diapherotrites archaeon]HIH07832.1 hypothetical protein [Candidatus Diapherotrites archaeon]